MTKADKINSVVPVEDYEHQGAKRTNNPPAGLAHLDREDTPTKVYKYDPHLDPSFNWAGKEEREIVNVPAPSIHVHEELSAQKIVGSVRKQRIQASLFDIDDLDPDKAIEFYKHEMNWSNRVIMGDSLVVMTSLIERERLAGQVQVIFMDPPYGIKYQSNFQPGITNHMVRDGADDDLTREPEMIQAYRDTWELGIHSYLTYLRDRMVAARELLNDSGSIFIQIGEENVHRVRVLLDEIFGSDNYISQITFKTTSGSSATAGLPAITNYILWYAKDRAQYKFRQMYLPKADGKATEDAYSLIELKDGSRRRMTAEEKANPDSRPAGSRIFSLSPFTSQSGGATTGFPIELNGVTYSPGRGFWKTNEEGVNKLKAENRLMASGNSLRYVRYLEDFEGLPLTNIWDDTVTAGFASDKRYVVQTNPTVIARCLLMTSDPGDLVIDPTCGSGTTAFVAEQYGRRWITIDTSRVALAIARERLLTAIYPYYQLRDSTRDVDGGFVYEVLPRITLRSITRGQAEDEVVLVDKPKVDKKKTRVTGPFTFEALSRYSVNPTDEAPGIVSEYASAGSHVETLLEALTALGVPRPGQKPAKIESLNKVSMAGSIQAEGVLEVNNKRGKFAVSLGPQFGAITMSQVSDAIRQAIGFDLVVFAGFAVGADVQEKLGNGKVGAMDVALLLANPDLLVGDLLKNTKSSQTFRLYASPDVKISQSGDEFRVTVEGVDSYDASTGEVTSFGKTGIQAWFLDDDYDGTVFRVSQAFFPVTNSWEKLSRSLRGTVDEELVDKMHSWESLPFKQNSSGKVAVRVIADDGNSSELIIDLKGKK
jgi:adenine-specific DNA-methyltransferase